MPSKPFLWNFRGRKSIRIPGYDYSEPGWYFVTICTQGSRYIFGEIQNDVMELNQIGSMVADEWTKSAAIRQEISLGPWVVMPNHLHMLILFRGVDDLRFTTVGAHGVRPEQNGEEILLINEPGHKIIFPVPRDQIMRDSERGGRRPPLRMQPLSLESLISGFKSATTSRYRNEFRGNPTKSLWQRNYWEHVIRSDKDYEEVADYTVENPGNWGRGELNPAM